MREVYLVPRNRRVRLESRLALLPELVHGSVEILELAARRILDNPGPGFVGFAQRHSVGMSRSTVAPQSLVGFFCDVWAAHHYRHAHRANCVSHAVSLRDHAGHGANSDESDVLFADESSDSGFIHRLGVAINEQYFVACRSQ